VLGVYPEFEYGPGRLRLGPGDALAVFTDGVTDAAPADGEAFGETRLVEVLETTPDTSAAGLVSAVRAKVRGHVRGAPAVDDFTLLVVERRSEESS
jgi:serine phosphatase RsbU (regulator of sigma subunit)